MNKFYKFACDVTAGRLLGCKDVIGGINKIFLQAYDEDLINGLSFGASALVNEIDDVPAITVFQYDLRQGTGSYTSNFTSDDATGTTYYEQVLEVTLQKIEAEDLSQLDLILKGRCQVYVLDNNDNLFLLGTKYGCTVTAGAMSTGVQKGDLSGFTLTFTGQEQENFIFKPTAGVGSTKYPFDNMTTPANVTITTGTYPS
tara:strand:- start:3989 stop:4588 length:600 start_codon:yes stop_codon:yes gene_type:complete